MKKVKFAVAALLVAGSSLALNSCIGSFALSNKVLSWNRSIGPKFVNELVFFAFWILPVYEITTIADLVVINSIEFWSGSNPLTASVKAVDTEHGRYLIACDGKGYTVTHETTGESVRLNFETDSQTWSIVSNEGEDIPFMTFIDDSHVKMITPDGEYMQVELSNQGVMAYRHAASELMMANR